jgi:hypothetical protein
MSWADAMLSIPAKIGNRLHERRLTFRFRRDEMKLIYVLTCRIVLLNILRRIPKAPEAILGEGSGMQRVQL